MKPAFTKKYSRRFPTRQLYRIAVGSFFFIQGLVFASWASRIPDIKNMLGLSDAALGGVLFCIPIGQMSAMAVSGFLVSKYGSRRMLVAAALLYPAVLVLLGAAATVWELSVALVLFGMAANLCNISVNTQGVGVERIYRRSIMASFHGLWSLAGFAGGLISTLMVGLDIPPLFHFALIYSAALAVVMTMRGNLMPRDQERHYKLPVRAGRNVHHVGSVEEGAETLPVKETKKIFVKPDRLIVILGLISFGCMICEGTMFEWSAVYFEQVIDPPRNLIRLGYIASMSSMAAGRFLADRFVTRFGVVRVLQFSGVTITAGLLTAVLLPTLWTATLGFLLVGLGVSSVVPICYSQAGRSEKMSSGMALAAVSTIGFLGFLLGPPVIGFVAQALDLRWSLGVISVMGLMATMLAPKLKKMVRK